MLNSKVFLVLRSLCLVLSCVAIQATDKACGSISDPEYNIILKTILKGTYDVPVVERTLLERTALRRYQRNKQFYSVENNRLYYKGKEIVSNSKCNKLIIDSYHKNKGIGVRRMYHLLKRRYVGVSEDRIKDVLSKLPEYQKEHAKFLNRAPLKHVCSNSVHEILQIDLVDMQREAVSYKREKQKFILSVMDIFSRFVWLRALPRKSADIVAKHLSMIFAEFGKPKIIQHDRGREFDGKVKRLLKELDIKNIKSRPYHPQSQGKVERMHKSLKRKIAYDLTHANPCGINWAKQLPEYQRVLNNTPKECLGWSTPCEIYYGRDVFEKDSTLKRKQKAQKIRDAAKAATIKCNKRNDRAHEKARKPPVYSLNETVLLRYKKRGLLNRRRWVVEGIIQKRSLATNMYKIKYVVPNSAKTGRKRKETKWYNVSDISRYSPVDMSIKKRLHRKQFYIPTTKASHLENLRSEFGLPIIMNPIGNGNCQFSAVLYQLRQHGIYRSEETMRQEVVTFLSETPRLGSSDFGGCWWDSILEQPEMYLARMSREFEFGDQITLQAMSQLYNVQIIVVSTMNSATTLISPSGSSVLSNDIPVIILGHYPEGAGEHYVALGYEQETLEAIIDRSPQITLETRDAVNGDVAQTSYVNSTSDNAELSNENTPNAEDNFNTQEVGIRNNHSLECDGNIEQFRDMVRYMREKKQKKQKLYVELPPEIWHLIVNLVLKVSPMSRFTLERVNRMFKEIVMQTPPPRFYLNPVRFRDVSVWPISVRKIISVAGPGSGLVQEIRDVINHSSWSNAWLFLRMATICGWYIVKGIWFRRHSYYNKK